MSKNKKILLTLNIISIIALSVLLIESVFAWFYFPSSKNLIINTAPNLDINVELYHLEANLENDTYQFVQVDTLNQETNTFEIDTDLVFFQWGNDYICESNKDSYYAIVATYDSNTFSSQGNLKLMLDTNIICSSEYYYHNNEGDNINIRFPIVDLSYAIAPNNHIDLSTQAASLESRNITYTPLTLAGEDDQSEPNYTVSCLTETLMSTLNSIQYIETYINDESQVDSRIKIVIYLKVTAAEEKVKESMRGLSTSFGSALSILINNQLTVSTNFRSVPMHTIN